MITYVKHLSIVFPLPGEGGEWGGDSFILWQKVALGAEHLPAPIFYEELKIYGTLSRGIQCFAFSSLHSFLLCYLKALQSADAYLYLIVHCCASVSLVFRWIDFEGDGDPNEDGAGEHGPSVGNEGAVALKGVFENMGVQSEKFYVKGFASQGWWTLIPCIQETLSKGKQRRKQVKRLRKGYKYNKRKASDTYVAGGFDI